MEFGEKIYKLRAEDEPMFYSPVEIKAPVFVSKNTEERMFVVDSGASMHTLSKKDLRSDEMETLRRSRNPTVVLTANGEVETNQEAQLYVHDLGPFVTVQVLEDMPAVLSFGKLCEEHGYSYEWVSGQEPPLTKKRRKFICKTDNFVPLGVPGVSSTTSTSSSSVPCTLSRMLELVRTCNRP